MRCVTTQSVNEWRLTTEKAFSLVDPPFVTILVLLQRDSCWTPTENVAE
jgi:hypothetical protein